MHFCILAHTCILHDGHVQTSLSNKLGVLKQLCWRYHYRNGNECIVWPALICTPFVPAITYHVKILNNIESWAKKHEGKHWEIPLMQSLGQVQCKYWQHRHREKKAGKLSDCQRPSYMIVAPCRSLVMWLATKWIKLTYDGLHVDRVQLVC